ncbi:hypothetical protein [Verrucomicrobium sp. BvORR106]|uniref:hypothetical protein n=1 Tax=Verrucomicrobium sp. BvORR106 TaxID=1403819 RepID=UPI00056F0F28|nr:hypothetical protein [Verrucomicrobium sp. BvORR106]
MKQPSEADSHQTPHPAVWPIFLGALTIYFASYLLGDVILLTSSFENWSDFAVVKRYAGETLAKGAFAGFISLFCPLGLTLLFIPIAFQSHRRLMVALVAPMLILSILMVYMAFTSPSTSKDRLAQQLKIPLPAAHDRYLAYHPQGSNLLVRIGSGIRDYYSFHLDSESRKTFLGNLHPSEERKLQLQSPLGRHADMPPEIAYDLQSPDLVVYPAGWDTDIVTHPASSRILIIYYSPPH